MGKDDSRDIRIPSGSLSSVTGLELYVDGNGRTSSSALEVSETRMFLKETTSTVIGSVTDLTTEMGTDMTSGPSTTTPSLSLDGPSSYQEQGEDH